MSSAPNADAERSQSARRNVIVRVAIIGALALAYLAVALAPVLLAWIQGRQARPFSDEFSSAIALAAFSMLLVEFVLSGRFRLVSAGVGIDLVMRMHQLLARTALVFVAAHPFLYSLPFTSGGPVGPDRLQAAVLTPAATVSGLLALMLLLAIVFFAVFRDQLGWRYETWRLTHGIGAALVVLFGTHHAIDTGRYSEHAVLAYFWTAMLAAALLALAHIYFLKPALMARSARRFRVAAVRRAAMNIWRLELEPEPGATLRYQAGQFAWLKFGRSMFNMQEFPFSFASAPAADRQRLSFLVKEAGDFTRGIGSLAPGTAVYLDGPHGNFTLRRRDGTGIVLIAGGIGIAPILSLLRHLVATGDRRPITVVYGNRVSEQIVALDSDLPGGLPPNVQLRQVLSEPAEHWRGDTGVLDQETLTRILPSGGRERWLYFVCGPPEMIDAVENVLQGLGVPIGQVVVEKFAYTAHGATRRDRLMLAAWAALSIPVVIVAAAFALR